MSWRPGELWLDADVLWFREGAAAPAFAGFAPALPTFGPPPGLIASRQRRALRNRRRNARRVRATALVLSPAVIIPLAAHRLGAGHGTKVLIEDPPSLTFRLSPSIFDADRPGDRAAAPKVKAEHRSLTRAAVFPQIDWHHAISVGLPYDGHLVDGTQLPVESPNWVTWDPVTDSVPNEPDRLYGNEHTIRAIVSVIDAYRVANPDAPRVVVGDISLKGGGPMTDEHVSHQNGLDVDIYYPRLDGTLQAPTAPDQIDRGLAQDLVDRFVGAGAQMIFVGYSTGLHGPTGVVIPYPNHDNHMHVRFPPPSE
jgi:Penicillin-insensitive murein endopeptidase